MARLYTVITDEKGTSVHKIARTQQTITVQYGSKWHSKKALVVEVIYPKDSEKPEIKVHQYV